MPKVLSDKAIEQLVKKISKKVEQKKVKDRPKYDDALVVGEQAPNQDELDEQFKHMKRRPY